MNLPTLNWVPTLIALAVGIGFASVMRAIAHYARRRALNRTQKILKSIEHDDC